MSANATKLSLHQPATYRIVVQGALSEDWAEYFSGFTLTSCPAAQPAGLTILTGQCIDQSMLLGILSHLFALGLPLLKVEWRADELGAGDDDDPTTALDGGNIKIHQ